MFPALLLALQLTAAGAAEWQSGCSNAEMATLASGTARMLRGEEPAIPPGDDARDSRSNDGCGARRVARLALDGWAEARALALRGGDRALVGPADRLARALDVFKGSPLALDAEYAQVAIRAAVAAAQEERPEMELLLTHARDLAERLSSRGRRATWPLPYNLMAGELWLEVDRFEEARQAFERAARVEPSPRALVGLGAALARLDRRDESCAVFRRVRGAAGRLQDETRRSLADCP